MEEHYDDDYTRIRFLRNAAETIDFPVDWNAFLWTNPRQIVYGVRPIEQKTLRSLDSMSQLGCGALLFSFVTVLESIRGSSQVVQVSYVIRCVLPVGHRALHYIYR